MKPSKAFLVSIAGGICAVGLISVLSFMISKNNTKNNNFENKQETSKQVKKSHHSIRFTSWTDQTFLEHMIPHHEEAVSSSEEALEKTQDGGLKPILQEIIEVQSREIEDMKLWYQEGIGSAYTDKKVYTPLMTGLESYSGELYDREWMQSMIYHHEAAIYMSKDGKKTVKDERLKKLMDDIVVSQSKQIVQMEDLLVKNRARK
jgi:uncharacterized protein (DUF305 family)